MTIELTPELRNAITIVFNDGQQNHDRGEAMDEETEKAYELVRALTTYAKKK